MKLSLIPPLVFSMALMSGCGGGSSTPVSQSTTNLEQTADPAPQQTTQQTQQPEQPEQPEQDTLQDMGQVPPASSTVKVTFEVTVPAYQSNELRVDVAWAEINSAATWVSDEYWAATAELPANTEGNLTITYYDRNGDIKLASLSQVLNTDSATTQTVYVLADQFDTQQYDDDADGTSNFDELIAGTDPRLDEATLFEIRDFHELSDRNLSVSQKLETRISEDRPYVYSESKFIPVSPDNDDYGTTINTAIEIDADGNGVLSYSSWAPWYRESDSGTRTNTGTSIRWEGSHSTYDGDYGRSRTFTSEVTYIDENTRSFFEEISESYRGTFSDTWEISNELTGELIAGTSLCKPVYGSFTFVRGTNRSGFPFKTTTTTVTKEKDDRYWKVVIVNDDTGEIFEHLARDLQQYDETPTFLCDFVD